MRALGIVVGTGLPLVAAVPVVRSTGGVRPGPRRRPTRSTGFYYGDPAATGGSTGLPDDGRPAG